jgi:hypothetical protein
VASDRRWIALALAVLVTACGGDSNEKAEQEAAAKFALQRARTDSIRQARRAADSLAQVAWTTCADSVTAALQQTAAGRKTLAAKRPEGEVLPAVATACGAAKAVAAAPAPAPAPVAGPASPLTPAQVELARADSARRAAQQADAQSAPAQATTLAATGPEQAPEPAARPEADVLREAYSYGGGARDPFQSLVNAKNAGPELADLQLVGVYQDMRSAANSVAIVREKQTAKRYKLRTGDQIGRLRVAQIRPKDVVFTIEDFGFERQETLSLRKQEDVTP